MNKLIWHTEQRKINELIPYEGNPRKMTKEQAEQLQKSLEKFNLAEIPAINTDNKIIAGHQRINILQILGRGEEIVDVRIPNRKLTDDEFREYNLRSNKNIGSWDFDELANFDIGLLTDVGFNEEELNIVMGDVEPEEDDFDADKAVEEIKEPICKRGDIWQLGEHRLGCLDATVEEDVKKLMDGKKADMVFTDPPYGVDYDGGVIHGNTVNVNHKREKLKNDNADIYDGFLSILSNFIDNGAIYIFYATRNSLEIFEPLKKYGFDLLSIIAWVKINTGYADMNSHYKNRYEPLLYAKKKGHKTNFIGDTTENTVWEIKKDRINKLHPTQKPIVLIIRAIKNHRAKSVLDLFGGSGSTLIACEQLNRKCYMAEIDPVYIQVILERYIKYKGTSDDVFLLKEGKKIPYKEIF